MAEGKTETKPQRKLTIKQMRAVNLMVENGGNVSKAMRDAGYSAATAKTPQKLTDSEYVQALMREVGLTDVDGFKVLKEGMESTKAVVMGRESTESFVDIQPDYATRHKYLETFIRVRGLGKQLEPATNINFIGIADTHKDQFKL